jgi:hypothetical protein
MAGNGFNLSNSADNVLSDLNGNGARESVANTTLETQNAIVYERPPTWTYNQLSFIRADMGPNCWQRLS